MCPRRRKGCKGSAAATIAQQSQRPMRKLILFFLFLASSTALSTSVSAQQFDLVLEGGRVMDPETGLDAVRNIGIVDGKIVRVSSGALSGRRVIRASGLVVAPGFIDLHQHGQEMESQRVKALDGVTTALELEVGAPDVAQFLKAKEGARSFTTEPLRAILQRGLWYSALRFQERKFYPSVTGDDQPATPEQLGVRIEDRLPEEIDAGGRAIRWASSTRPAPRDGKSLMYSVWPPSAEFPFTRMCAAPAASIPARRLSR